MTRTYTQMHRTDKYSEHSSIIWPVWPNGWVFVYELSGSGFESSCSHLNFRFRACFEQGVPWYSSNYRVWIHFETRTWHEHGHTVKDIMSLAVGMVGFLSCNKVVSKLILLMGFTWYITMKKYIWCFKNVCVHANL